MPKQEFENIDVKRYRRDNEVGGDVKALVACFNTVANTVIAHSPDDHIDYKIFETVKRTQTLFQEEVSKNNNPLYLSRADQTYLMLEFMQIAAKLNTPSSKGISADYALFDLPEHTNKLFKTAVEKKLIAPEPADML
jgi:hypothetical protein